MYNCNCENNKIELIVGDTLNRLFVVSGENVEYIQNVYFICKDLGISQELQFIGENEWLLNIDKSITANFEPMTTDYDIKINFTNNMLETVSYQAPLEILENKNKLVM